MEKYSIFLRPFKEGDHILINKWRNDPNLQKYTVGPFQWVSEEMEREWVHKCMMNNRENKYWAICPCCEPERMIGYTSLNDIDHFNKKAHWGGIVIGDKDFQEGTAVIEAAILVHQYAFESLNLNRLSGCHFPEHPFTPIYSKALGWSLEGIKRQSVYKENRYRDLNYVSILREDYESMKEAGEYDLKGITRRFLKILKEQRKEK